MLIDPLAHQIPTKKMDEVLKQLKEMLMGLSERFNISGEKNMDLITDYTKEETYRVSNLYITLNIGILSAASFVFSSVDLAAATKPLVPLLALSFISILFEIHIRKRTLEILRAGSNDKIKHVDKRQHDLANAFRMHAKEFLKCTEEMAIVSEKLNEDNFKTNAEIDRKIRPYLRLRRVSEIMICGAVISLLLIALSQLGILKSSLSFWMLARNFLCSNYF